MQERVSRAEAARQLGVDKATITRMVQGNPALLDDSGRVNVGEIATLRQTVLNPKLQTRLGVAAKAEPAPAGPNLNLARGRTENVKADMAEMELAERLGMTLRKADVEDAVAAAGNLLKQTAFAMARDKAEVLARIEDVREMERALEELIRDILTKGVQALQLAASPQDMSSAA